MIYLLLALFVYMCFALKNNKIINRMVGNEIIVPAERNKQKISWLAVAVLILFSGFRATSVGGDLGVYRQNFSDIAENHDINAGYQSYGIIFRLLNLFCSFLGPVETGFALMLLIMSVVNVFIALYVAKTLSPDISITMFLFVCIDIFVPALSTLRQSIATILVILSFKYIYERDLRKFLMCVIAATGFHESALFILPLYILNYFCENKKNYTLYGVIGVLFFVFAIKDHDIIRAICKLLNLHYYSSYQMKGTDLTILSYIKNMGMILVFVFFLIVAILRDAINKPLDRKYILCLNIYFMSALICLYNIVSGGFLSLSRMIYYFSWSLIFLVPCFIKEVKNKNLKKWLTIMVIVIGILYLSTVVVLRDQFSVVPYRTIFGI